MASDLDLTANGFERFPGYVRMRTDSPPQGAPLPQLKPEHYCRTMDGAYRGLWGHKLVPRDAEPPPGAIVLGLYQRHEPIGVCTVLTAERLIDGPGVLPHARHAAAYTRLLLGACAELGAGGIDLDSWGDSPTVINAYEEAGFDVAEHVGGWQLRLA